MPYEPVTRITDRRDHGPCQGAGLERSLRPTPSAVLPDRSAAIRPDTQPRTAADPAACWRREPPSRRNKAISRTPRRAPVSARRAARAERGRREIASRVWKAVPAVGTSSGPAGSRRRRSCRRGLRSGHGVRFLIRHGRLAPARARANRCRRRVGLARPARWRRCDHTRAPAASRRVDGGRHILLAAVEDN